jgi:hypothetical protein
MGAVRIHCPRPDLSFVEMNMSVDQTGPYLPTVEIDAVGRAAERSDCSDAAVGDVKIEANKPLRISRCRFGREKRYGTRASRSQKSLECGRSNQVLLMVLIRLSLPLRRGKDFCYPFIGNIASAPFKWCAVASPVYFVC